MKWIVIPLLLAMLGTPFEAMAEERTSGEQRITRRAFHMGMDAKEFACDPQAEKTQIEIFTMAIEPTDLPEKSKILAIEYFTLGMTLGRCAYTPPMR